MSGRRQFLRGMGACASLMAIGRGAGAQIASDYKAIVCIYMAGGNDAFNTVLATDDESWAAYSSVRNQTQASIALNKNELQPISLTTQIPGRSFALHPKLVKTAALFNTHRRLAIVANVGTLVQPLTKTQYAALLKSGQQSGNGISLPKKLFSHNDQQTTWQALGPEGTSKGWGGLLVDSIVGSNPANAYASISLSGNSVWLSGNKARQYQLSTSGPIVLAPSTVYSSTAVAEALRRVAGNGLVGSNSAAPRAKHALMMDLGTVSQRSISLEAAVSTVFSSTNPASDNRIGPNTRLQYINVSGATAVNPLAQQLQAVARLIAGRSSLGPGRQIFFVQLGGFDTHDNQLSSHSELMLKVDHALDYFDTTLGMLGVQGSVTTFTASDFGRTFTSNGDGTDHGWGGHHFVLGGAVSGGRIIGSFPKYGQKNANDNGFDSSEDMLSNGVLLPKLSVEQLGATLGKWFGSPNLDAIFPNLKNHTTKDLGIFLA